MPNHFDLKRPLSEEFVGAPLGDERLSNRLVTLGRRVGAAPDVSFPQMCGSDAELEALYRFLGNERVTPEAILAPHVAASVERCAHFEEVLVAHDSSEAAFPTPRANIGRLQRSRHGFLGHFSLALGFSERQPP